MLGERLAVQEGGVLISPNSDESDEGERLPWATSELEACREKWPEGLAGVGREISVLRVDKRRRRDSETRLGRAGVRLGNWLLGLTPLIAIVLVILTFADPRLLPSYFSSYATASAILFFVTVLATMVLFGDVAFARTTAVLWLISDILRSIFVYGSRFVSMIFALLGLLYVTIWESEGMPEVGLTALLMLQGLVSVLAYIGLAMAPPLLGLRPKVARVSSIHSACLSAYMAIFVFLGLAILALGRDAISGAVPLALLFAVSTWVLVQISSARKEIENSSAEVLDAMTDLEVVFGRIRREGARMEFDPEFRSGVLKLQSVGHKTLSGLAPGHKGRPRADHPSMVVMDYLAVRVATSDSTRRVMNRELFLEERMGEATDRELQYLIADFVSELRVQALSPGSLV